MKRIPARALLNAGRYRPKIRAAFEIALEQRVELAPGFSVTADPRAGSALMRRVPRWRICTAASYLTPGRCRPKIRAAFEIALKRRVELAPEFSVTADPRAGSALMRRVLRWRICTAASYLTPGRYRPKIRAAFEIALKRRVELAPGFSVNADPRAGRALMRPVLRWGICTAASYLTPGRYRPKIRAAFEIALNRRKRIKRIPAGALLNAGRCRPKIRAAFEIALKRRVELAPGFSVTADPRAGSARMKRIPARAIGSMAPFLDAGRYWPSNQAVPEIALKPRAQLESLQGLMGRRFAQYNALPAARA